MSAMSAGAIAAQGSALRPYTEKIAGTLVTFEMLPVAAGTVQLQTPAGVRTISVAPLWVAKTEVTWDLYDVYLFGLDGPSAAHSAGADAISHPSKPYVLPGDAFGHGGYPALGMSLFAAKEFARWVSAKTGYNYRLPTEAEWIHICRTGQSEPSAGTRLASQSWFAANAKDQTHPVAALPPNRLGVHDMLGNAAEWVVSPDSVVMGGAFDSDSASVNCTARNPQVPAWNVTDPQLPKSRWWLTDAFFVGMRLVRTER
jgi:formylglycine-generating enzyme required for sulfatase activity